RNAQRDPDAGAPEHVQQRNQGRLIEPDVAIQGFVQQHLLRRGDGKVFLGPEDARVAEMSRQQYGEKDEKESAGGQRVILTSATRYTGKEKANIPVADFTQQL